MYQIFLTRRSVYYCVDCTCVAVRNRASGALISHEAIGRRAFGMGVDINSSGDLTEFTSFRPQVGQRLSFEDEGSFVLTSPIVAVLDVTSELFDKGARKTHCVPGNESNLPHEGGIE
jgi:hypothetical protein